MYVFRCKMCGHTIESEQRSAVCVCEHCGTVLRPRSAVLRPLTACRNTVAAGRYYTASLKADGSVTMTKYIGKSKKFDSQCDVSGWTGIVAVSAGYDHTAGLKADGTVAATKYIGDKYKKSFV